MLAARPDVCAVMGGVGWGVDSGEGPLCQRVVLCSRSLVALPSQGGLAHTLVLCSSGAASLRPPARLLLTTGSSKCTRGCIHQAGHCSTAVASLIVMLVA
jgi:hypothetical protein